jgi:hypothetical protein
MNLRCEIVPCLRFTDAHNETERRWPSSQFQSRVISWANRTLPPGKVRVGGDPGGMVLSLREPSRRQLLLKTHAVENAPSLYIDLDLRMGGVALRAAAQDWSSRREGRSAVPSFVRLYSTLGGTSG